MYTTSSESVTLEPEPMRYLPTNVITIHGIRAPTGVFTRAVSDAMHADVAIAYTYEFINLSEEFEQTLEKFHVLELALYWCTRSLSTSTKNGTSTTTEHSSFSQILTPQPADFSRSLSFYYNKDYIKCYDPSLPPCQGYGGTKVAFAPPPDDALPPSTRAEFWSDLWTALAGSYVVHETLAGGILQTPALTVYASLGGAGPAFSTALFSDSLGLMPYGPGAQMRNMRQTGVNIAHGLTNALRRVPPPPAPVHEGRDDRQGPVLAEIAGTAYVPRVVFRVRWQWLVLVSLQVVVAWFLFGTVTRLNRKSGLAPIRRDLVPTGHVFQASNVLPEGVSSAAEMTMVAKTRIVKLDHREQGKGGLRLVSLGAV